LDWEVRNYKKKLRNLRYKDAKMVFQAVAVDFPHLKVFQILVIRLKVSLMHFQTNQSDWLKGMDSGPEI
jgi:ABC-type proline/glycine betaine transport system ATPase subunit